MSDLSKYTDLLALSTSDVILQVPMSRLVLADLIIHDASVTDLVILSAMITKRKRDIKDTMYPPVGLVEEEPEEVEVVEEEVEELPERTVYKAGMVVPSWID
jgi:hypothetical protein